MQRILNIITLLLSAVRLMSRSRLPTSKEAVLIQSQLDMHPTAKNLRKLAEVPFFKGFSREQLDWVDKHTDEYAFSTGEIIPTDGEMKSVYWILLYGSIEIDGKFESKKVTDLGYWFQRSKLNDKDMSKLKATSTSYILMVSEKNMIKMKEMGCPLPVGI